MKLSHIAAAAGLALASLGAASSANARPYDDHGRHEWRHDDRRHWGQDRRWHHRCHTEWRHHHRVRVCR